MGDSVNHPSHYQLAGGMEVMEIIRAAGLAPDFCLGNALKYILRARSKGREAEDLRKAAWYLHYAADLAESEQDANKPSEPEPALLAIRVDVRLTRGGRLVAGDTFVADAPTYMQLGAEVANANFDEAVQDMISHVISSGAGRAE